MKQYLGLTLIAFLFSCNSDLRQIENQNEDAAQTVLPNFSENEIQYLAEGKKIAGEAQGVLGKNLMNAIQTKGTKYAVEFCNIEAINLTDSMAVLLNASIKRVSDLPRNNKNQANNAELAHIQTMKDQINLGEAPNPLLAEIDGKMVGYYAILTNSMCLNCHGDKKLNIQPETFDKIKSLYPSDKAIGYGANQLRGMWVVEMDKK